MVNPDAFLPHVNDDPETLEEAIERVKAITDPDPIIQNRKRAEEAKRIVRGRVEVINNI